MAGLRVRAVAGLRNQRTHGKQVQREPEIGFLRSCSNRAYVFSQGDGWHRYDASRRKLPAVLVALALRSPALTRSWISARSNSAMNNDGVSRSVASSVLKAFTAF